MKKYQSFLKRVLYTGTWKENRTGERTLSLFNHNYEIDISKGFPLLTGKKINFDNILFELLWFLSRDSSPDFLHKHGIKFWDLWIEADGNLPKAYGEYWRKYPDPYMVSSAEKWIYEEAKYHMGSFDQFASILDELKKNPNSRRLVLTNWFPPSAWSAKLPPCHLMGIFNVQHEKNQPYLNLSLFQRSADVPIGVPFNIASYALLLEIVSRLSNIPSKVFAHTCADCHIYENQIPAVKTYLERQPKKLPKLIISDRLQTLKDLDELIRDGTTEEIRNIFKIENYDPHPYIKMPVMV